LDCLQFFDAFGWAAAGTNWNFEYARNATLFNTKFTNRLKKMTTFIINVQLTFVIFDN